MDSPYTFRPLSCDDCGTRSGPFYRDSNYDEGSLIVCRACKTQRIKEAQADPEYDTVDQTKDYTYTRPTY